MEVECYFHHMIARIYSIIDRTIIDGANFGHLAKIGILYFITQYLILGTNDCNRSCIKM